MKSSANFWHQVDVRIKENQTVIPSGFSPRLAKPLAAVGLHFWLVGLLLSGAITIFLWLTKYAAIMRAIRIMIWR